MRVFPIALGLLSVLGSAPMWAAPQPTSTASAAATPAPSPEKSPVILFIVDNSASLPPLDPDEKRVAALEKMFTFLQGQRYRLVLFGGRSEIFVDDVSRYHNNGQWTDFYFAFEKVRDLIREYPSGTEFRMILLTDALLDPSPDEWKDMNVPAGADLKAHVVGQLLGLLKTLKQPLYVILVGDPPKDPAASHDREQAPVLVLDMIRAANGAQASPMAQSLASFFGDNGLLLKKFVYRVAPHEGLKMVAPVVKRIVAPPDRRVEQRLLVYGAVPPMIMLVVLLGLLVRSFPGPGDVELIELNKNVAIHVTADRNRRMGLSLARNAKDAGATFTYQAPVGDFGAAGLDTSGVDDISLRLLPLGLDDLRRALDAFADEGTKEEKIFALNLDYMARSFDAAEAERILKTSPLERRKLAALDFLRAKVHLLSNADLCRRLTEPRVTLLTYGKGAERKELQAGARLRLGRYRFVAREIKAGGRKDVRVALSYDRVPSLLGLKTILPGFFQKVFRLRRSSQRVVS